jgi:hypothetical protein
LATVVYTWSIWRALTARPFPIGTVPILVTYQWSGSSRRPAGSPGKPTPVREPNPNARR